MKFYRYLAFRVLPILFCCLLSGCGKDDLEDRYYSITGTWAETNCVGYMSLFNDPYYIEAAFDPDAPASFMIKKSQEDGVIAFLIACYKWVITEPKPGNYAITVYRYNDDNEDWNTYLQGTSTDGRIFTLENDNNYTLRILTGTTKELNAAFLSKHSSTLFRLTFVRTE